MAFYFAEYNIKALHLVDRTNKLPLLKVNKTQFKKTLSFYNFTYYFQFPPVCHIPEWCTLSTFPGPSCQLSVPLYEPTVVSGTH